MLALSLAGVFVVFCLIMGALLMFCIRHRRQVDGLGHTPPPRDEAVAANDSRIIKVLFGAMLAGVLLALLTGYLVFLRTWE